MGGDFQQQSGRPAEDGPPESTLEALGLARQAQQRLFDKFYAWLGTRFGLLTSMVVVAIVLGTATAALYLSPSDLRAQDLPGSGDRRRKRELWPDDGERREDVRASLSVALGRPRPPFP